MAYGEANGYGVAVASGITIDTTEVLSSFSDSSTINIESSSVSVLASITESFNSFLDASNAIIAKDISINVTEVLNSFSDNSNLRLPANWNDKPKVTTTYTSKQPVSTIWIDRG